MGAIRFDKRPIIAMVAGMLFTLATLVHAQANVAEDNPSEIRPEIRIGVLKFGTVDWFLDTMLHNQLDQKNGFKLIVVPLASKNATSVALLSGSADAIVTDWFWAMRERNRGNPLVFKPYSTALGSLVTSPQSPSTTIAALKGKRVGIAGGPLDKSWLIMQALVKQEDGKDLAKSVNPVFAAPPLLNAQAENGALDAVLNYWHYAARLQAKGFQTLITVSQAMTKLGIDPTPPLVGFVHQQAKKDAEREKWHRFDKAIRKTNAILATSEGAWQRLREKMRVESEAEFIALRDAYRGGIVTPWTADDLAASKKLFHLLREIGGEKLLGENARFDPALFPEIRP